MKSNYKLEFFFYSAKYQLHDVAPTLITVLMKKELRGTVVLGCSRGAELCCPPVARSRSNTESTAEENV